MKKKNTPIKLWANFTPLPHIPEGPSREKLEARVRLKKVRYMLYRLRNQVEKNAQLNDIEGLLPGFIDFWLGETPTYALDPSGNKIPVPGNKQKAVRELGSFGTFAQIWDVDDELVVYLRHSSVWQEWNAILYKVVPIITED